MSTEVNFFNFYPFRIGGMTDIRLILQVLLIITEPLSNFSNLRRNVNKKLGVLSFVNTSSNHFKLWMDKIHFTINFISNKTPQSQ